MSKLIPVFIFAMIMSWLSDRVSYFEVNDNSEREYIYKDRIVYKLIIIVMSIFCGLRLSYNDTGTYRAAYIGMRTSISQLMQLSLGDNPFFHFSNYIMKTLRFSVQSFLMVYAVITVGIYIWFIRKYSRNFILSIFLLFALGVYTFTFAAIKQTVAVAFCLLATDRAVEKKWIQFAIWIVIASLFHPYALMYLIVPFLSFAPWSKKTYYLLGGTLFICLFMQTLIGTIVSITSMVGEEYSQNSLFGGASVNIFRLAVVWMPVLFTFLVKDTFKENQDRSENIIINLMMINALVMLMARFGTALFWARLANYFLIFQTMGIPFILRTVTKNSRTLFLMLIVICYFAYFYYADGVMFGGFDYNYSAMPLTDYLFGGILD